MLVATSGGSTGDGTGARCSAAGGPAAHGGLVAPPSPSVSAAAFGSLGQGKGLAAAWKPSAATPGAVGPIRITMIIGLALIESLVIYALIIAFMMFP